MYRPIFLISVPFAVSLIIGLTYWIFSFRLLNIFDFGSLQGLAVLYGAFVFAGLWLSAVLGAFLASFTKNLKLFRRRIGVKLTFICSAVVFFFLFADFLVSFFSAVASNRGFLMSDRQYIDSLSMFKIGLLALSAWNIRRLKFIPISLCFFGIMLVFLDISREAAVPALFAVLMANSASHRILAITSLFFIVAYSMYGRDFPEISIYSLGVYSFEAANYFFGMNFLHFSDAIGQLADQDADFTFSMFLQSIVPLPGGLVSSGALDGRNLDAYRPIGAAADLVLWNGLAAFLVFFSYGYAFGLGFSARSRLVFILAVIFSLVCFSWLFQYHLRTSGKYILFFGFMFLLSNRGGLQSARRHSSSELPSKGGCCVG